MTHFATERKLATQLSVVSVVFLCSLQGYSTGLWLLKTVAKRKLLFLKGFLEIHLGFENMLDNYIISFNFFIFFFGKQAKECYEAAEACENRCMCHQK